MKTFDFLGFYPNDVEHALDMAEAVLERAGFTDEEIDNAADNAKSLINDWIRGGFPCERGDVANDIIYAFYDAYGQALVDKGICNEDNLNFEINGFASSFDFNHQEEQMPSIEDFEEENVDLGIMEVGNEISLGGRSR